jgi:hypothetical protein
MATFKVEIYVEEEGSISSSRLTVRADGSGSPSLVADRIRELIDSPVGKHAIWPEHYPDPASANG